ncbi:MAG: hypothetical protein HOP29_17590 [Phycisphaerales bacterium]|nr:hypothetical protein [Phycisphaerales bacterium]
MDRVLLTISAATGAFVVSAAMTGCARPAGPLFEPVEPAIVFPSPPDAPRIRCIGAYRGSDDLRRAKTGWEVTAEWLNRADHRPTVFSRPHAVAVGSGDRIYVADGGMACVHLIDMRARRHMVIDHAGETRLRSPAGIAVAGERLFVSDAALAEVFVYSAAGEYVERVPADCERPGGLAVCGDTGRMYVVDTSGHRVVMLSRVGNSGDSWAVDGAFGQRGRGPGEFNYPTDIACDPAWGIVVSDTLNFRVQRFDFDGKWAGSIGGKGNGAGDFSLPKGVAVDRHGHLYVVDAQFENVQVFQMDGRLLMAFGEEGNQLGAFAIPAGIAIDDHDRIWVADAYNRRLQMFQYLNGTG